MYVCVCVWSVHTFPHKILTILTGLTTVQVGRPWPFIRTLAVNHILALLGHPVNKVSLGEHFLEVSVFIATSINPSTVRNYFFIYCRFCGPGCSVGIETGYGLDGPGIESRWGWDFSHTSRPALGPPSLPYNGFWVLGVKWPGRGADNPPPLLAPKLRVSSAVPLLPL
jgi:hypothetical protein